MSDAPAAPVAPTVDGPTLAAWVRDARSRTLDVLDGLSEDQLEAPYLPTVNPLAWELCHVGWFQEHWVTCHALGEAPQDEQAAQRFDSSRVGHEARWNQSPPPRERVREYLARGRDRVLEALDRGEPTPELAYFVQLSVFHEDMHVEAFATMGQALGHAASLGGGSQATAQTHASPSGLDVEVPGGSYRLGAEPDGRFVHDNEKWAHERRVEPFAIATEAVTADRFRDFVEDGGYLRRALWSPVGWGWRQAAGAEHPVYWRRQDEDWQRRHFDRWVALEPEHPVVHVGWYEAEAWCRWAGRRLPTELEWEVAAASEREGDALSDRRRRYPWGDGAPTSDRANLDGGLGTCLAVNALSGGDSAFGCRQMMGNAWEWTASTFQPYPGFVPDPYEGYSQPWFGARKVLRGGSWASRGRMLRNTWRNFFTPDRRDVIAGFRTCAVR